MRKIFKLLSLLFILTFCVTGCSSDIKSCPLETIEATSYVKEEAHFSGGAFFYCIFGSYKKDSYTVQRYIFLARNGRNNSYMINDISVYADYRFVNATRNYVYFQYIEDGEEPYLEYQEPIMGNEYYYWLHLPKASVLQIANDMFKDI